MISLRETCAWRQDVWTSLLQAARATRVKDDSIRLISDVIRRTFKPDEFQTQDRSLRLAYMKLRQTVVPGTTMLADCEAYWKAHANLITCYADIRPFVEALSREDRHAFSNFVDAEWNEIFKLSAENKYPYQDVVT